MKLPPPLGEIIIIIIPITENCLVFVVAGSLE
jgi:hypothetical protein